MPTISIDEMAEMVGSIWVRTPSHIFFGRVTADTPEMKRVTTISSKDVMKAKSAPESRAGLITGRVTLKKAAAGFAPRLNAAFSRFGSRVGARRASDGSWPHARTRQEILSAVHDNLRNLGLDALDVVNLRLGSLTGPEDAPFEEPLTALAELKQQGLIRHIGLSTVSAKQLAEAQAITEIVCIQNFYNVAQRGDDGFIDALAAQGIAYVPYFPLGGFSPLQSSKLDAVAASLGATPMQVALAWLLRRSPNVLLIPGTSSVGHLRENLAAAKLELPEEVLAELDGIGVAA